MNKDVLKFQDVVDINSTDKTKFGTILLVLLNGSDNIDAFQAIADVLQEKGFKVILAIDKKTFDMIDKTSGYVKEVFDCDPIPDLPQNIGEVALNGLNGSPIDKIKNFSHKIVVQKFEFVQRCEQFNENLVKRIRPELIIIESFVCSPVLTNCGIPWVWINFSPPNICKNDNRIPPGWSGKSIDFNHNSITKSWLF